MLGFPFWECSFRNTSAIFDQTFRKEPLAQKQRFGKSSRVIPKTRAFHRGGGILREVTMLSSCVRAINDVRPT